MLAPPAIHPISYTHSSALRVPHSEFSPCPLPGQHQQPAQGNPAPSPPSEEFVKKAHIDAAERDRLAAWAEKDPDGFWAECAPQSRSHWFAPFTKVLDWSNAPHAQWFVGGKLNASFNCLDRHLASRKKEQGRDRLGRRARRLSHPHVPATSPRCLQIHECPRRSAWRRAIASRSTCDGAGGRDSRC